MMSRKGPRTALREPGALRDWVKTWETRSPHAFPKGGRHGKKGFHGPFSTLISGGDVVKKRGRNQIKKRISVQARAPGASPGKRSSGRCEDPRQAFRGPVLLDPQFRPHRPPPGHGLSAVLPADLAPSRHSPRCRLPRQGRTRERLPDLFPPVSEGGGTGPSPLGR